MATSTATIAGLQSAGTAPSRLATTMSTADWPDCRAHLYWVLAIPVTGALTIALTVWVALVTH